MSALLDGPRAREAFLLRSSLAAPWSMHIRDEAPLTVLTVARGGAWILPEGDGPVGLGAGDVAVIRGPSPYTVSDQPATPPQVAIEPGQICRSLDRAGRQLVESFRTGVRTWGNTADAGTVMLTGTYPLPGEVSRRLLHALPTLVVLRRRDWSSPLVALLTDEIVKDQPGQEAVLNRLLDLLVIAVLRAWFDRAEAAAPSWYDAHGDPVVGRALALLHHNPAHAWTVAELAHQTGSSRALLARRFTELVGQPPMSFLCDWRLALAADLLLEPGATLASVAHQIGYSTPFALSTAFKRIRGLTPQEHRARCLPAGSKAISGTGRAP